VSPCRPWTTLIPAAFAIAEQVQWLAVGGGPAKVMATTRSATSGASGWNRSCQHQITVLALPVGPHDWRPKRKEVQQQMAAAIRFLKITRTATKQTPDRGYRSISGARPVLSETGWKKSNWPVQGWEQLTNGQTPIPIGSTS
jgi:hypothetical protein